MKRILALLICLFTVHSAFATDNTHQYKLDNGLQLIVKVDKRAPIAIFMVWYKVGSGYEPAGNSGLSHMLEHMMFKGTNQHPADSFSKLLAQHGGDENAFTSYDFTAYYQKWGKQHIEKSFAFEADRMKNLILSEHAFSKENKVVQEERYMRTESVPRALTHERLKAAAHLASPYHHPIIGWMDDIKQMKLADLKSWYKQWYAPNNAIIVIAGDVDPHRMHQLAKQYFGPITKQKLPTVKPQKEPPPLGKRIINVAAPAKLPHLIMAFNTPSIVTSQESWEPYALAVLATILDGGKSARLETNLIRGKQIAASTGTNYELYNRFDSLFTIEAIPRKPHTLEELEEAILEQINNLKNKLVSKQELKRVKAQTIAAQTFKRDSLFGTAMEIGRLVTIDLPHTLADEYLTNIQNITPEQVQAVAKKYLNEQHLTTAILTPTNIKTTVTTIEGEKNV